MPERQGPFQELAARLAALRLEQGQQERALEAEVARLQPNERLAAEARGRMDADRISREIANLEAIQAVRDLVRAQADATAVSDAARAEREQKLLDSTERLLWMTKLPVLAAFATLGATILVLIFR